MKKFSLLILLCLSLPLSALDPDPKAVGFLFFGDSGTGKVDQFEVARGMKKFCALRLCQFVALLGDNFYPAGVKSAEDPQWQSKFVDAYEDLKLDFFPALGNHDYEGNVEAQIEHSALLPIWNMPARYFSFSRENVDFFVIDTNRFDKAQKKWLKEELESSVAIWKIVYGHHPVHSYGSHGETPDLVKNLLPLLEANADFYLSGHDHDKQVLKGENLSFVVSGAAATLRPVGKGPRTVFAASTLGFSHFQIEKRSARLRIMDGHGDVEFEREFQKRSLYQAAIMVSPRDLARSKTKRVRAARVSRASRQDG